MITHNTPEQLRQKLEAKFPPNATCWSKATDEVRDLCRYARYTLDLPEEEAVDFRPLLTPSQWNTVGINGIITFYERMHDGHRAIYTERYSSLWGEEKVCKSDETVYNDSIPTNKENKMTVTAAQFTRTTRQMSDIAKEPVELEQIGSGLYAFGSELATLRIFAKYNSNGTIHNAGCRCGYSENLGKFYFVIDLD